MSDKTLNITWLYPDLLNLHGDRGNLMAFKSVGEKMGLQVNINRVDTFSQEINFDESDIIFMNAGEIKTVKSIVENIKKYGDAIYDYAEKGKVIVAIGTTGAVLGKELKRCDSTTIDCLGLLDVNAVERKEIYGDDIHFTLNDENKTEIVGVQIHLVDFFNENTSQPLGNIVYGKGNNDCDYTEGCRKNNVIFTNALGPVFVKNPWFTQMVIKDALKAKGIDDIEELDDSVFDIERKSAELIKLFIKNKTEKQ